MFISFCNSHKKIRAEVDEDVVFRVVEIVAELEMVGIIHRLKFVENYMVEPCRQDDRVV